MTFVHAVDMEILAQQGQPTAMARSFVAAESSNAVGDSRPFVLSEINPTCCL